VASRAQPLPAAALPVGGRSAVSALALTAVSAVGVAAFLYPFILSEAPKGSAIQARSEDAPLVFALLLALALLVFVLELTRDGLNAKSVSLLAVVTVAAAVLRLPTLPAGATAFFFLVILGGYAFGPRLGFLLGAGAMFVSAFAVGGFGPWLPYQMFAAGWVGMTAGWLGAVLAPALAGRRTLELVALALFAAFWGFLFGAIMNVWFWPYVALGEEVSWKPGLGLAETLRNYWSFYVLTSLGWDAWRALAGVLLILAAGRPTLDLLLRYRDRFQIRYR
jgi:energy-coupling factor transport system substrate-specific component